MTVADVKRKELKYSGSVFCPSQTIRKDSLTGRTPTFLRTFLSDLIDVRFATMLLFLLHKQVGHIADDGCSSILSGEVAFLKGGSTSHFIFGQGEDV